MNETLNPTPTSTQQLAWVKAALEQSGFEEMSITASELSFCKDINGDSNVQIIVNIDNGKPDVHFLTFGNKTAQDNKDGLLAATAIMVSNAMDGAMPTQKKADEMIERPTSAVPDQVVSNMPTVRKTTQTSELSIDIIKKYINDKVTDEEAYVFLQLCQSRGLNPFLKEAYLIKYAQNAPATMVVGKDAFLKRGEAHKEYNGFEAGIILEIGDDYKVVEEREGTFYADYEKDHIIGGWAKIYRKDQEYPTVAKVAFSEYVGIDKNTSKPNRTWGSKPATMIRKVALVQALREAFPSELSGMYDQSEMGVDT